MGADEQIKEIEDELARTKYNKATQKHVGILKAKLARLKSQPKASGGGGLGYSVRKTGDATVILVGFPSVGKSTLLNAMTNADSKVAGYDFTTLTVIPGMLEYRGARIQVLDVPGIIEEAASGKGRGKEVLSVVRNADLLLVMLAGKEWKSQKAAIENELYLAGFRLNQGPPDILVAKKSEGGMRVERTRKLEYSDETIREVLKEFRVLNGEVLIRGNPSLDQLIDALAGNRKYLPAIFMLNKSDIHQEKGMFCISARDGEGVQKVKELIWEKLELKRVFLKKPGKPPDMEEPLILRGKTTVRTVGERFNLMKHFKFAKIWGPTARFPGQKVGPDQALQDQDVVEIHN